jgi:flagellum-specific ATP synthase
VLSRQNAQQGIFPAIDLPMSVSRVMNDIVPEEHIELAERLRALISCYLENRDLILLGGYNAGQNEELDVAIKIWPEIVAFLKQKYNEPSLKQDSLLKLGELLK